MLNKKDLEGAAKCSQQGAYGCTVCPLNRSEELCVEQTAKTALAYMGALENAREQLNIISENIHEFPPVGMTIGKQLWNETTNGIIDTIDKLLKDGEG